MNRATPVQPWRSGVARKFVAIHRANGGIGLVWLGPSNGDEDQPDANIWYSEQTSDRWIAPQLIFSADRLDWRGYKPSVFLKKSSMNSDELHLVVAFRRGTGSGIAHIRHVGAEWLTTEAKLRGLPSQVAARLVGEDSMLIAYAAIGAPGVTARNGQHIFSIRVGLNDSVWPAGNMIQWSGLESIKWMQLYSAQPMKKNPERFTLVWTRIRLRQPATDTLYSSSSIDGGTTWTAPQKTSLPIAAEAIADVVDDRGVVNLFVSSISRSAGQGSIYHIEYSGGNWGSTDLILSGRVDAPPTVSLLPSNQFLLAWASSRPANGSMRDLVAPVTQYSFFRRQCTNSSASPD